MVKALFVFLKERKKININYLDIIDIFHSFDINYPDCNGLQ